ncbi:MAG TPA: hypothetical protein DHV72_10780 [Serratia grimesii]|uniref:DUF2867 domain-containing protein n=1 Tax=Serratia grimesii TaxID=82995 RepID=A0A9C7V7J2_9GAMM|nr:hypothetical protein [Serratia grimesii]HCK00498.1 hypothetical protein [Serratia grimesii]
MAFLGFVSERECQRWEGASPYLPAFSFYEKHQSEPINASPEAIIQAVRSLDMTEDPIIRRLLMLRQLPGKLRQLLSKTKNIEPSAAFGFDTFTLLQHDSHEVSLGLTGRFWRPMLDVEKLETAEEFHRFSKPDAAKLVLRFSVTQDSSGLATLCTETFVWCPTPQVKVRFACYWAAIRPASGWIRRRTLLAVQQKLAHALVNT